MHSVRYWIVAVFALAWISTTGMAQDAIPSPSAISRPFRLGVWTLAPRMNHRKPLAMADAAGWVRNSGRFIGAFTEEWVGALVPETGDVSWWLEAPSGMTAPPGSFGSWVVLGFRDGTVMKVEALTGKKIWSVNLESFTQRSFTLNGTTLLVLTAAQVLHALDFQTGKILWLHDAGFPDDLTIRGGARPIIHDGKVLFGISSGEILAVNLATGKLLWRYNPAYNEARFHAFVGEMVMVNDTLVISRYDGLVAAIDLASATRAIAWQDKLPGLTASTFRDGRFYVGALNGDVYCFDADSGRRLWRLPTGSAVATLTAGETALFVAGSDGIVSALNASTGALLWHDDLGGALASPPILDETSIYFATGLKNIYGYKIR